MQFPARVQAVIELIEQLLDSRTPADRLVANYVRSRRYIGSKDRAVINELFYSILRRWRHLECDSLDLQLNADARVLVALFLAHQGESVEEIFSGEGYAPMPLSATQLLGLKQIHKLTLEDRSLAINCNVPEWIFDKLRQSLGEDFKPVIDALNQEAPLDLRVNTLKSSREAARKELQAEGLSVDETSFSPWGLRLNKRINLSIYDSFKSGKVEVQDEGSQLLALLTAATPGMKVVDFCAGAGGKTLAMAAMMDNRGSLWACDVHSKRLEQLKKRAKRAGAHNVRIKHLSTERDKWVKHHKSSADVVLVDAPCSGTGTWRRNPDSRLRLLEADLDELRDLQASILQSAARLVKPGGSLIYATCSLLQEENQEQIKKFLDENAQFEAQSLYCEGIEQTFSDSHEFLCLPSTHGTDGFYLAKLIKRRD